MSSQGDAGGRRTRARRTWLPVLALTVFASALWAALASAVVAPPSISGTTVSRITETSARLEGNINPNEREVTAYFFEYVDQDDFEAEGFKGATKTSSGKLPAGKDPLPVSAQAGGLAPGTTYHVRIFAKNQKGETEGPAIAFTTFVTPEPFGTCPNDAFRGSSPSGALPDCRAYEQASPVNKNSGEVTGDQDYVHTSLNGDRISFNAYAPIPGGEAASEFTPAYLAIRGGDGWTTRGLMPPAALATEGHVSAWTPDFAHVFAWARLLGNPSKTALYDRDPLTGSLGTIVPHTAGVTEPVVPGSSDDGSVVLFENSDAASLTPNAAKEKPNLYAWDRETGAIRLAGVFNDEKAPPGGSFAGSYHFGQFTASQAAELGDYTHDQRVVSADGSSVYFITAGPGQLYQRKNPAEPQSPLDPEGNCTNPTLACTYHVSTSQRTLKGPDPAGSRPADFVGATKDGSEAFFTSTEMLTDDANTGPEQPPGQIGRATIGASEAEGVEEDFIPATHAVGLATSPDGEYIYWADPGNGTIGRAKLNGSGAVGKKEPSYISVAPVDFEIEYGTGSEADPIKKDHVSSPSHPRYVAVDDEYVYWTNTADGVPYHGTIGRAKIGSEGPEEEKPQFIIGASKPQGIAVNDTHIYWVNRFQFASSIARAEINGNAVQEKFCYGPCLEKGGGPEVFGLALSNTHLYFANFAPGLYDGSIESLPLEGGSVDGIVYVGAAKPEGVAVEGSHVYWTVRDAKPEFSGTPQHSSAIGRAAFSDFPGGGNICESYPGCKLEFVVPKGAPAGLASDGERLYWSTNGEVSANPGNDLYRYDAATGKLTDVAPDSVADNGAEVQGVLGNSEDGSLLYFAANGVLAEGASPGSCHSNTNSFTGKCNLYLDHAGQVSFVAPLNADAGDEANWSPRSHKTTNGLDKTSRISPDGRTLLFTSAEKLTDYENAGKAELYRYRFGDPDPILCVSCNPTGLPPSRAPNLISILPTSAISSSPPTSTLSRNISADGNRVFFETSEALVAADTNGAEGCPLVSNGARPCQDVYEWEAKGTGSCKWEAQNGGCLYLISTGKSPDPSYFGDASASGDDVFFFTRERLLGQDKDSFVDVYDARVGGGLASQVEITPPVPCEGEACKGGASTPPEVGSPATPLFSGPGNQKPRHKKAKAKKKKRHHKQKRHAKKHGRAHR